MSELIAAKAKGELLERYEAGRPAEEDDQTESEYVRELLDGGLAAREQSLYERVGLPARLGARLEDERRTGESEADVVREVLEDGIEARQSDVLDAIGASEELREAVEARRKEGEPLDDAARRLLREGTDASRDEPRTVGDRAFNTLVVGFVTGSAAGVYAFAGAPLAVLTVAIWVVLIAFDDVVLRAIASFAELTNAADDVRELLDDGGGDPPDVEERDREAATDEEPA